MREKTSKINTLEVNDPEIKIKEILVNDEIIVVPDERMLNFDFGR